ncbi:SDR family oxidoreductase [Paenibacillus sp. GCM10012306]|uniref:SDR family oxidoreductase n=1 Tax=Paenibacillus sp. GCM10012306 TaxID=3317342 RepID=UPI0036138044
MSQTNEAVLVTGANGQLGQLAIEWLLEHHQGPIIVTSRDPQKLSGLAERGVIVRQADFDQPASLPEAFAGAKRLLLISTDALDVPGQRVQQHLNAIEAAVQAGVEHLVYTSLPNPESGTACLLAGDHYATEEKIKSSGLSYTILRNHLYTHSLIPALQQAAASGQYAAATGNGATAYVTREDCAHAAAAALVSSFSGHRTLDVSGPEALTGEEIAAIASEFTGQDITFVPLTTEQLVGIYEAAGLPNGAAQVFASFQTASSKGEYDQVTTTVKDLTGQAPISLKAVLAANKSTFTSAE